MAGFWDLPTPGMPQAMRERLGEIRHTITHHHYTFEVCGAVASRPREGGFAWFAIAQLAEIPFSTTARKALRLAGIVYNL
jgi:adenine-specific DNA glycosylase